MAIEIREHSFEGWHEFASKAGFVPDPMILRAGEVFVNGLSGTKALGQPDLNVWAALQENIAGLSDFFDLVVTRDRIPLIDYDYTFDVDSVARPLKELLGAKALPVTIGYEPYNVVKRGAFNSLRRIELPRVQAFGSQLRELDSLRYDWQPKLRDYQGEESWLSHVDVLNDDTCRAARFLLGGFIFSGFAQASGTDHYIQPKRSRFFLSLTAAPKVIGQIGHDVEQQIFDEALEELNGTTAVVHRLDGLPPVLPYLIAKAGPRATAPDILKFALAFPETTDGKRYCAAAADLRKDGVQAQTAKDAAFVAREEALKMLKPFSRLAEHNGGFHVEVSVGMEGPKAALSRELHLPAWLRLWWNDQSPFGGVQKTFRRMWMAAESYQRFEKQIREIWGRS
jgi:hypothetical protein